MTRPNFSRRVGNTRLVVGILLTFAFILTKLFLTAAMAQTPLEGIDCSLTPEEHASVFQEPVRPVRGVAWEITNEFGNVVTKADVPGLPRGFWQHVGVDYLLGGSSQASQRQTVYAAGSGVVVFSTTSNPNPLPRRGGLVIIRHFAPEGEPYQIPEYEESFTAGRNTFTVSYPAFETQEVLSYYLHLDPDQIFVSQGDQVIAGQPVAKLYRRKDVPREFAYVPHLHFEIWKRCSNIERNGYDGADTEFQQAVTDLLVDPMSSLSFLKRPTGNGLVMRLFDTPDPIAAVESGFAGLSPGPFTVTTATGTSTVSSFVVPVVNFPDTEFDVEAFFNIGSNGAIDAGSTALAPVGDDISIQPPGGNDTFGASFTGFLFLPTGGDVTFSVGIDDVFDLIVDGESVLSRLELTDFQVFSVTVQDLPAGFIPIALNFAENFQEADIVLSAEGGGLPDGIIPQEFLFTEIPR